MSEIDDLENRVNLVLMNQSPTVDELKETIGILSNYLSTNSLDLDDEDRIRKLANDAKKKLMQTEASVDGTNDSYFDSSEDGLPSAKHNEIAEEIMRRADEAFYEGRYSDAFELYNEVLDIEPDWERAKLLRKDSYEYLSTGRIPKVALPAEVARFFGQAQSAIVMGRYKDASDYLIKARAKLHSYGISRWEEGLEFEGKLQQLKDANNVYIQGWEKFKEGEIDEAIDKIQMAFQATNLPRYNDRLIDLVELRKKIRDISDVLYRTSAGIDEITHAKSQLERLMSEYGEDNPIFVSLNSKCNYLLESKMPSELIQIKKQLSRVWTASDVEEILKKLHRLASVYTQENKNNIRDLIQDASQKLVKLRDNENDIRRARDAAQDGNYEFALRILYKLDSKFRSENMSVQALFETCVCYQSRQLLEQARALIDENNNFFVAERILERAQQLILDVPDDVCPEISEQLTTELDEARRLRAALKNMLEAKRYLDRGDKPNENTDGLLKEALDLDFSRPAVDELKTEARLLLANTDSSINLVEELEKMVKQTPTNQKIYFRYQFEKWDRDVKRSIEENKIIRKERMSELDFQKKIWFWLSIATAFIAFGFGLYIVFIVVRNPGILSIQASILSMVTTAIISLGTNLVYKQSLSAGDRADKLYGGLDAEMRKDRELQRKALDDLRKELFGNDKEDSPVQEKTVPSLQP
jgi:tetratricopeptide (TPR) repeat protein